MFGYVGVMPLLTSKTLRDRARQDCELADTEMRIRSCRHAHDN